mmetsp:Transcript_36983/g.123939  ORF Transcript_36983/g.123939 Transcript_36983/m.123939 type:complete len:201 (+) Transcript_36983:472-1074(+)
MSRNRWCSQCSGCSPGGRRRRFVTASPSQRSSTMRRIRTTPPLPTPSPPLPCPSLSHAGARVLPCPRLDTAEQRRPTRPRDACGAADRVRGVAEDSQTPLHRPARARDARPRRRRRIARRVWHADGQDPAARCQGVGARARDPRRGAWRRGAAPRRLARLKPAHRLGVGRRRDIASRDVAKQRGHTRAARAARAAAARRR